MACPGGRGDGGRRDRARRADPRRAHAARARYGGKLRPPRPSIGPNKITASRHHYQCGDLPAQHATPRHLTTAEARLTGTKQLRQLRATTAPGCAPSEIPQLRGTSACQANVTATALAKRAPK
jgi:hypothetical protein